MNLSPYYPTGRNYGHIVLGASISIIGYLVTHFNHIDILLIINQKLSFLGKHVVEEIAIWSGVFSIFVFLQLRHYWSKKRQKKIREVHESMLYASNYIIRNLLYQTKLMRFEAEESIDFDDDVLNLFDQSVNEAEVLIKQVSSIDIDDISNVTVQKSLIPPKN